MFIIQHNDENGYFIEEKHDKTNVEETKIREVFLCLKIEYAHLLRIKDVKSKVLRWCKKYINVHVSLLFMVCNLYGS